MIITKIATYKKAAREEARSWDRAAAGELKKFPPDYKYYRETLPYKIYRRQYVARMLSNINPGDRVLELGCYNGWFSLEMARKGARVNAYDISAGATQIGKKYYQKMKRREKFTGAINYFVTDLNFPSFTAKKYDKIVIRNVLHHLTNLESLFIKLNRALKPDGKILVDDGLPCGKLEALITGGLLFLLPTDIPYSQKLRRIFKTGQILKRTQGLVDACGASPFEGASGEESVVILNKHFKQLYYVSFTAFVGSVAAHLKGAKPVNLLLLNCLNLIDKLLIKIRLIRGTGYYLEATHKIYVAKK